MPSIQRKDIDNTSAVFTVTVSKDELKPKINAELKNFRSGTSIPGFRQGQASMDYIKRRYGAALFNNVLHDLQYQELYKYLNENKVDILGQPLPTEEEPRYSLKIDNLENEYSRAFEVGFVPPFEIRGLSKDETFERLAVSNLDELAEHDLDYARKRMGKRTNPEDDIQLKDILKIAARELDGDDPKTDGWQTTITVYVDTVADEALKKEFLSRKKGDTLRFNARQIEMADEDQKFRKYILNLPEDDERPVGDWFEGSIEEVSRIEIADLNDEFYSNYFGESVSSREEAMERLKKGIQGFYDMRTGVLLMRDFQKRLVELNDFELPDTFLKRWLLLTNQELTPDKMEEEYADFAKGLRWSILRNRLKQHFSIEVSDDEVRAEFAGKVRNYFQTEVPDEVLLSSVERLMQEEKNVEETVRELETDKIFAAVRELVTVKDKPASSDEIHAILEAAVKSREQHAEASVQETVE